MESSLSSHIVFSLLAWRNSEEGASLHKGKIALIEFGLVGAILIAPIEMLVFAVLVPLTALLYPISRAPLDWAVRGVTSSATALRLGLSGLVNNIAQDLLPASEAEVEAIEKVQVAIGKSRESFAEQNVQEGHIFFSPLSPQEKDELKNIHSRPFKLFVVKLIYHFLFNEINRGGDQIFPMHTRSYLSGVGAEREDIDLGKGKYCKKSKTPQLRDIEPHEIQRIDKIEGVNLIYPLDPDLDLVVRKPRNKEKEWIYEHKAFDALKAFLVDDEKYHRRIKVCQKIFDRSLRDYPDSKDWEHVLNLA